MFKNLNNIIDKKKKFLVKSQDLNQDLNREIKKFLLDEFGKDLEGFSFILNYQTKDNSLSITTSNKVLSSELTLRLGSLSNFLKDKRIKLDKILIR